jgi:EAL domain-containing protein (putative c-di-GMP-specific phosphodiesterase class I)
MAIEIQQALADGLLYIAYQPLVDLKTHKVFAYEGLVRSTTPEFPDAGTIIRAAVAAKFMGELGRALRRLAIRGCPDFPLFLNVHPDEFDEGWLVRPDDSITEHERDVFLEITESVPLSHYRHCHSALREIRAKGVKIAVDDLGAGYSNLKYIADLAPEVVKLDRELIANLARGSRLHQLVISIVDLCRKQGARVVCEGIETREEMLAVLDSGAHYGQGFFLARPHKEPPPVAWDRLEL